MDVGNDPLHRPAVAVRAFPPRLSRPSRGALLLLLPAALALPGCRKPSAAASGAGLYCPDDLSGDWFNESDRSFSYRLKDHGDRVEGSFVARVADGGVTPPEAFDEPLTLELHRSPTALAGVLRSFDRNAGTGRRCPVEFGLRISRCAPGELQVISELAYPIAKDCSRQTEPDGGPLAPELAEFLWTRAKQR